MKSDWISGHREFEFSAQCFVFKEEKKKTDNQFLAPNMGSQIGVFYSRIEIIDFKFVLLYLNGIFNL